MKPIHVAACLSLVATLAQAQSADVGGQVGEMTMTAEDVTLFERRGYSPYAGRAYPTQVFWGDTHLHTANSLDARAFGALLDPAQAYRFARGEEVTTSHGLRVKLSRPLDWLVVADHSDGMGAMGKIVAGDATLLRDPKIRDWHERVNRGGEEALRATLDIIDVFSQGNIPEPLLERRFAQSV